MLLTRSILPESLQLLASRDGEDPPAAVTGTGEITFHAGKALVGHLDHPTIRTHFARAYVLPADSA